MNGNDEEDAGDTGGMMFRFFVEIGIIAQLSGATFEKVMPMGLTLPQFSVLNHLVLRGGNKTPLAIANAMQVTKGTMTSTLAHLQRAGHIGVRPDPRDGRSKRVDITASGRAAHGEAIAALGPELAWIAGRVPADRITGAMPLLREIRELLDARRDEAVSAGPGSPARRGGANGA